MKKIKLKKFWKVCKAVLVLLYLMSLDITIYSQPGLPGDHGQNGDQGAGGMAPLGEGLIFFLIGSVVYGFRKLRKARKRDK